MIISKALITFIIALEGFSPVAYWDNSQWTNGYGTKAAYAKERVDKKEAEKRLVADLQKRISYIKKLAPNLNNNEYSALASFCYNVGLSACTKSVKLVHEGKKPAASWVMRKYTNNGNKGLVERRKSEVALLNKKETSRKIAFYSPLFYEYTKRN